jgi:hypothetical protein
LSRGIKPNLGCLENIKSLDELKEALLKKVERLDARSIQYDLEALIDNVDFVKKTSKNIKDILKNSILSLKI